MRPRQALLIFDNCEHLLENCARIASSLIRGCPSVRVLVTSREMLGVSGETAWRVPSLTLPEIDEQATAATIAEYEAIRLFVDRAVAVQPSFAVTDQNASALVQVCHRLDGIPLAIELAAARVRVLPVEQIAARLNDRFRLLTGGGRTALRRQQTLQSLVDWSHDLLSERERAVFRRLAVFAGGWTLEAAEAVCQGDPVDGYDVLDLLTSLVDKSLVVTDLRTAAERYTFLETLRQYAEDKLLQAGEAGTVRDRHRDWCIQLARSSEGEEKARERLRPESDNLRAALTWCASDDGSAGVGLTLISLLGYRWGLLIGGGGSEARRWLETLLAKAPEPSATRARALLALGHHLRWFHEFEAAGRVTEEALSIYRDIPDEHGIAAATAALGLVAANQGDYELASRLLEEALVSSRRRDDTAQKTQILRDLGVSLLACRDFARARVNLNESARLAGRSAAAEVGALLRLAILDRLEGDHASARNRLASAGRNDFTRDVIAWANLLRLAEANQARAEGRFDEARAGVIDVLRSSRQRSEFSALTETIAMMGICEIAAGNHARGVTLIAVASNVEGPIGTVHMPDVRVEAPVYLDKARAALGAEGWDSAWAEGSALTLDQAVSAVLAV